MEILFRQRETEMQYRRWVGSSQGIGKVRKLVGGKRGTKRKKCKRKLRLTRRSVKGSEAGVLGQMEKKIKSSIRKLGRRRGGKGVGVSRLRERGKPSW